MPGNQLKDLTKIKSLGACEIENAGASPGEPAPVLKPCVASVC